MSKLNTTLMLAGLLAFAGGSVHAAGDANAQLTRDQANAEHERIEATYKADKDACKKMDGNAKDICEAEAKGKQDVANAEIDYKRSGSERDRMKIAETRAKAEYAVAKERCEDRPRDQQSVCKKEAEAAEKAAIANAKKAMPKS